MKWAEDIRRNAINAADNLSKNYDSMQGRVPTRDKNFAVSTLGYTKKDAAIVKAEVMDALRQITSAKDMIDIRDQFSQKRMEKLAKLEHRTGQVSIARKKRGKH